MGNGEQHEGNLNILQGLDITTGQGAALYYRLGANHFDWILGAGRVGVVGCMHHHHHPEFCHHVPTTAQA